MNDLLLEFLSNILDEAPVKKPGASKKNPTKSPVKPDTTVQKPANAKYPGKFGRWYSDAQLTKYVGKVKAGKWIDASVEGPDSGKSATGVRNRKSSVDQPQIKRKRGSRSTVGVAGTPDTPIPTVPKDKSLIKINSTNSQEFKRPPIPTDSQFKKDNTDFQIGPPPPLFKFPKQLLRGLKVPPRHLQVLERMLNTRVSPETVRLSHFTDAGGAGQISAQAGELMTLISSTLSDKDADVFFSALLNHESLQINNNPSLKSPAKRIVTKDWVRAAMANRSAIMKRLNNQYPGFSISAGAWDTESEVSALGLRDYKKNKGFSTDIYLKIKTPDGSQVLDEISLKKSTAANLLNSSTGKFLEWDANITDDINPTIYSKNQRESLLQFGTKNKSKLLNLAKKSPEIQAVIKAKKVTIEDALDKLSMGKGSRGISKVILTAIKELAKTGDSSALDYLRKVDATHKKYQVAAISALGSNKKLKAGMLASIREEFPLKAVGEGEESMAIGDISLDKDVMQAIFDTSDFNTIRDGLFAVVDEDPPFLAYKAGRKGRIVPIATIEVREDGVGYGGQIKFDMKLDKRFAKILKAANEKIYGN
jgi:hypothetical protein